MTVDSSDEASTKPNPEGFGRSSGSRTDLAQGSQSLQRSQTPKGLEGSSAILGPERRSSVLQRSQTPKGLEGSATGRDDTDGRSASTKPNPEGFGRVCNRRADFADQRLLQRSQTPKGLEGASRVGRHRAVRRFNEAKPRRVWKVRMRSEHGSRLPIASLQRSQTPKGLEGGASRSRRRFDDASTKPNPEGFGRSSPVERRQPACRPLQRSQTPKGLEGRPRHRIVEPKRRFNEAKPRRVWKARGEPVERHGITWLQRSQTPKGLEGLRSIDPCFNEAKPRRVWKARRSSRASTKPNPEGFGRHTASSTLTRSQPIESRMR